MLDATDFKISNDSVIKSACAQLINWQSKLNFETDFAACINSSPEGISDGFKPLVFQLSQTFLKCCNATSAAISPSKIDAIVSHSIA